LSRCLLAESGLETIDARSGFSGREARRTPSFEVGETCVDSIRAAMPFANTTTRPVS
jgi:hypothetical protein